MFPTVGFGQNGLSVSSVDGLQNGKITPDNEIVFHIRLSNNSGKTISTVDHGFRIYLSNNSEILSAQFQPAVLDAFDITGFTWHQRFDGFHVYSNDNSDGLGADTVSFKALSSTNIVGFENQFDQGILLIYTGAMEGFVGDSLCIDSCFVPSSGLWRWSYENDSLIDTNIPWSGPHCFEITEGCCVGIRGNVDNSSDNIIDVSDLELLVTYMFLEGAPPACSKEADINGDTILDISDLLALVGYMFLGGVLPANCQ